jgi:hypothetical protein
MDIKNLPRAQTTIDVVWDQFGWSGSFLFSGRSTAWWRARQSGLWVDELSTWKKFRSTNKVPITCRARVASRLISMILTSTLAPPLLRLSTPTVPNATTPENDTWPGNGTTRTTTTRTATVKGAPRLYFYLIGFPHDIGGRDLFNIYSTLHHTEV